MDFKHADANHIISFNPALKSFKIYSIPRDTPTDIVLNDTAYYKLTEVRAKGRNTYFAEIKKISSIQKIDYYVEFGFSQAKGILEWLGYSDPASTLQVLRSRKAAVPDDFQRHYNQANFMKQVLVRHFSKIDGLMGNVIIGGALSIVDTDISFSEAKDLIEKLAASGFPEDYTFDIKVLTSPGRKYQEINFQDESKIAELKNKIESYNSKHFNDSTISENVEDKVDKRLQQVISQAVLDSAISPNKVINKLKVYYEQKSWLQLSNIYKRNIYRDEISNLLISAYINNNDMTSADKIKKAVENEKLFMQNIEKRKAYLDSLNNLKIELIN